MSHDKLLYGETANGPLKQYPMVILYVTTMRIVWLIHAPKPDFVKGCLLVTGPTQALPGLVVIHKN